MARAKNKPIPDLTPNEVRRFWALVNKGEPDECWPWIGTLPDGYGRFTIWRDGHKIQFRSNRIAFRIQKAKDLGDLFALHHCDNPPCCNGEHLYDGTAINNCDDKVRRGRTLKGDKHPFRLRPEVVPRGSKAGNAKFTEEDISRIRTLRASGRTYRSIGDQFETSAEHIFAIVKRKLWKHVP